MYNNPTTEQAAIISSTTKVQLIDAVAGSGKTTTLAMVARDWALRADGTGRIACLSFTESAKRRFIDKLKQEGAPKTIIPATVNEYAQFALNCLVRTGLIDRPYLLKSAIEIRSYLIGAANSVWQKYEEAGESEFDFAFEHNTSRIEILVKVLKRLKAQLKVHTFESEDFHSSGIYDLAEELDLPIELIEICAAYERMRRSLPSQVEWQTEDDLVPDLVDLLKKNPSAINAIPRVSLFLIDEWHDVNAAEFELINIIRRGARLVVVSDRDQVIDEARGAELRLSTTDFFITYSEAKSFPLSKTRRFGPILSRGLAHVASRRIESIEGIHTTVRKLPYDPTISTSCAIAVIGLIKKIYSSEQKIRHSDIAIVVRESDQSIEIENALLESETPYHCFGIDSYLLRPEILMLRALLHLTSGSYEQLRAEKNTPRLMVSALAMFASMSRNPKDWEVDYHKGAKAVIDPLEQAMDMVSSEPPVLEFFFSGVLCKTRSYDSGSMRQWKQRLTHVIEELRKDADQKSAAQILEAANSMLDLSAAVNRALLQRSEADSAVRSIKSFIKFAENFNSLSVSKFLDELSNRQRKVEAKTASRNSRAQITLASVKSAKGHEWAHVIIPYLQSGEFPRSADINEERRFLYVAATRAKDSLSIAVPADNFSDYRSALSLKI
jgi:DNA helicase-2/ATP-dependent DNA helicase PcrA